MDPGKEANFLTALVLGLFVMLRAKAPPKMIEGAARVAIEHLEALRARASARQALLATANAGCPGTS